MKGRYGVSLDYKLKKIFSTPVREIFSPFLLKKIKIRSCLTKLLKMLLGNLILWIMKAKSVFPKVNST